MEEQADAGRVAAGQGLDGAAVRAGDVQEVAHGPRRSRFGSEPGCLRHSGSIWPSCRRVWCVEHSGSVRK